MMKQSLLLFYSDNQDSCSTCIIVIYISSEISFHSGARLFIVALSGPFI